MGREAGQCTIISDPVTCSGHDTQPCGHPVCFTDQRTQSLLSSSVPLTQTRSTSPHTHTQAHTLTPTHTHRLTHSPLHTQPHTPSHSSHTPHSPSLTHTYSSHTLIHHLHIPYTLHKHTLHTHIHPHTYTPSHPHTHTLFIPSHAHTLTHSSPAHIHTHTHTHTHTHNHRAYRSEDTGNTGTQGQCSHTRHVERVGAAQSPSGGQTLDLPHTGSHWDPRSSLKTRETVEGTQADPAQSRQNLTAL